ncbi:hypothetical protein ACFOLM_24460 [Deinococcus soli (ex Cha et al. 2016)]|uniref:hypothetical protein n=1 Tax=Deinococcus soli (ex Cha et al. 2016) TaxID=1309411 RepID=UPI00198D84D6|nr:hypothetical protein GCM10008019_29050 [Deinococcus soli (ex Cha et al. 2016)]
MVRRTTWRDPATQRAIRTALTVIITPLLAAVLAALAGRLSVIIQVGGIPADLHADAVGHATWLTQRVWEACMPALLIALAAAVWVNPAQHRLILCGGLATALAITGWSCGFGVPLWALVPSAALAIGRALTTTPR